MGLFDKPSSKQASASNVSKSQTSQNGADRRTLSANHSKGEKSMAIIGQSIVFKGELSGDEDLEIDGQVEGSVELSNNELTVGANAHLKAEVHAKSIVVVGRVNGNLTATERIEVQSTGIVEGDLKAPRLVIQEGAVLNGGIDMTPNGAAAGKSSGAPTSSASSPSGGADASSQQAQPSA